MQHVRAREILAMSEIQIFPASHFEPQLLWQFYRPKPWSMDHTLPFLKMHHPLQGRYQERFLNQPATVQFFFFAPAYVFSYSSRGSCSAQGNRLLDRWLDPVFDEGCVHGSHMALWCTIRTFSKHAIELGNQQPPSPVFFVKPNNCIQRTGQIPVSNHIGEVHHEIECVLRLNQQFEPEAIAVGLDLTDRLVQSELRSEQLPWTKGKCFKSSAYIGGFRDWHGSFEDLVSEESGFKLNLWVNNTLVQSAPLSEMTITPRAQIEELKSWAPIAAGDYLFTGTPSGVGQLHPNDSVYATLEDREGTIFSSIETRCK
ncbi:MAG: hypothetical protein DWC08_00660 [Candidatus Poseidoniales archaeon]|nr:MAG: hypothetical protein DWC08_00660 [Candidatus Poseidoniales archaeon]